MIRLALALVIGSAGLAAAEESIAVVNPEAPIVLRDGVALPPAETVRYRGRRYTARFVPEGGALYSDGKGGKVATNLFLVGGTDRKMRAVAVYLKFCLGEREVDPIWGDEPVPKLAATGEWAFEYPNDCPEWSRLYG